MKSIKGARLPKFVCVWAVAASTVAGGAQVAHAQSDGTGRGSRPLMLDEITVTAQKRTENVQDVPIAISAFTAGSLAERAVNTVASLSNMAPNVTLDAGTPFSGSSSVLSAFIRGIGQNDFAANLDPGVGVYLDGIYLARTVGANLDMPDVERVEILKGPQGTLFGRNTIGGAISIVTRDPGDEFMFKGSVTTGRYNRMDVSGSVDIPVSDTLLTSLTYSSKNRDGFLKRIPYPGAGTFDNDSDAAFRSNGTRRSDTEGGQDEWTVRGKVLWQGNDRLTVRLSGDYLHQNQEATANTPVGITPDVPGVFAVTPDRAVVTPFGPTALYDETSGLAPNGFTFAGLYNFCIGSTPDEIAARNATAMCGSRGTPLIPGQNIGGIGSVNVDADPTNDRLPWDERFFTGDIDTTYATGISFSRMKNWGVAATIDYELTDWMNVKSITGYRDISWATGLDADGSPIRTLEFSFSLEQWQVSQELQFTGSLFEDRLNYVFGGYYFKENNFLNDYVTFNQGLLQIYGPNDLETENYAFFGQVDYAITDRISVTLGGRYTHESKSFNGGQSDLNGFNYKLFNCPVYGEPCTTALGFPNTDEPLRYYINQDQHKKFNNFSPKIGLQYRPDDDVMVYGSFSKGYKTGGWTTRLSNPLPAAADFEEEEAETWELGVKSQLFNRRLQVNAAVFTTDFTNIQLNFQQGVSPTFQNAGDARIKGVEVDTVAVVTENLTVNASVGYIDSKYTRVEAAAQVAPNAFQAGTFVGATLPKTPDWKINVSPRYELMFNDGAGAVFLLDYTYIASNWNDAERNYLLRRPAVHMLNASATYREAEGRWSLTVGGTNLADERYLNSGGQFIAAGVLFGNYNRPREWYARLDVQF